VQTTEIESVALATRPPPRYTEATLLTAMEGAGKLIEDDELRAAMAGKGLGTPATRAQIIENLIDQRYVVRDGKDLRPTRKAFDLMTLLKGLDVPELTAPELTGEWEFKLAQMERGKLKRDRFMHEIAGMTQKIVERAKSYESDTVPIEDPAQLKTPCPSAARQWSRTIAASPAPAATFRFRSIRQPVTRGRGGRGIAGQGHDRADVGLHQQNGPALFGGAEADTRIQAGVRLWPRQ